MKILIGIIIGIAIGYGTYRAGWLSVPDDPTHTTITNTVERETWTIKTQLVDRIQITHVYVTLTNTVTNTVQRTVVKQKEESPFVSWLPEPAHPASVPTPPQQSPPVNTIDSPTRSASNNHPSEFKGPKMINSRETDSQHKHKDMNGNLIK